MIVTTLNAETAKNAAISWDRSLRNLRALGLSVLCTFVSVRDGELAGDDRAGARQLAATSEVRNEGENRQEGHELHRVARACLRDDLPHQPECRLGPAHRPDRSIEVAPLPPLA